MNSVRNKGKLSVFTVASAHLAMTAYRNTALLKKLPSAAEIKIAVFILPVPGHAVKMYF